MSKAVGWVKFPGEPLERKALEQISEKRIWPDLAKNTRISWKNWLKWEEKPEKRGLKKEENSCTIVSVIVFAKNVARTIRATIIFPERQ